MAQEIEQPPSQSSPAAEIAPAPTRRGREYLLGATLGLVGGALLGLAAAAGFGTVGETAAMIVASGALEGAFVVPVIMADA
ncbi:MAG TPA: hypothetical protein VFQ63_03865 [Patescibacteria group bacterium]|nr:hypothetical protein [Patescibacteria group bacterium]